jgi:ribosomal protein S6--L-glutamate ligase
VPARRIQSASAFSGAPAAILHEPPVRRRPSRPLRIAVLSRKAALYANRRFRAAAAARGHSLQLLDPLQCYLSIGKPRPQIWYRGRELRNIDVVLPRIGPAAPVYGVAVVHQFELMGVPVVNASQPIARARDKLLSLQLLAEHEIPVPRTVVARSPSHLPQSLAEVGGPPVVLKLVQGTHGVGVMLADSRHALESTLDTLWSLGQNILIQEFVAESRGRDIRALVMDGRIVAAMRREARIGEFRSNIHRGGRGTALELDPEYARVAIQATRVTGLEVAGVDMLESAEGPKLIEINSSPGFEGLERATGLDIAERYIILAEEHVRAFARRASS